MPKITNWEKSRAPAVGKRPTPIQSSEIWNNEVDKVTLVVSKTKPSRQGTKRRWFVETRRQRGQGFIRFFDTKKEAKGFAVEWMRNQPRG